MADKVLVGSVKAGESEYGKYVSVGFHKDDIKKLMDNLGENGWCNMFISKSKANNMYAEVKPSTGTPKATTAAAPAEAKAEDMPF